MRTAPVTAALLLAGGLAASLTAPLASAQSSMSSTAQGEHGIETKFNAANTTHDGRLTKAQADAGDIRGVSRNFAEIDKDKKGYVTLADIKHWMKARRVQQNGALPGNAVAGAPTPNGAPPSDPQ